MHAPKAAARASKEALAQQRPRPCAIRPPEGPRQRASVKGEPGSGPSGHGAAETRPTVTLCSWTCRRRRRVERRRWRRRHRRRAACGVRRAACYGGVRHELRAWRRGAGQGSEGRASAYREPRAVVEARRAERVLDAHVAQCHLQLQGEIGGRSNTGLWGERGRGGVRARSGRGQRVTSMGTSVGWQSNASALKASEGSSRCSSATWRSGGDPRRSAGPGTDPAGDLRGGTAAAAAAAPPRAARRARGEGTRRAAPGREARPTRGRGRRCRRECSRRGRPAPATARARSAEVG